MTTPRHKTLRAGHLKTADDGTREGYARVLDVVDLQGDVVRPGAFHKSVSEQQSKLPIMAKHLAFDGDAEQAVGVCTSLREDARGLFFRGRWLADRASQEVRGKVRALLDAGSAVGCSIGYRIVRAQPPRKQDGPGVRQLLVEIALKEVTLTLEPACEEAQLVAAKSGASSARASPTRPTPAPVVQKKTLAEKLRDAQEGVSEMIFAQARDAEARERAHVDVVTRLLTGKPLSGREQAVFGPREASSFHVSAPGSITVPRSLIAHDLPAFGEAIASEPSLLTNPSRGEFLHSEQFLSPQRPAPPRVLQTS